MQNEELNKLGIKIVPSDYSNDHQVEIKIDNINCIEWFLWIDPVVFFKQKALFHDGELIIWRCGCWEVWCGSKTVRVKVDEKHICWIITWKEKYTFLKDEFINYLDEKKNDTSWENLNRRTERLVWAEFKGTIYKNKYFFDWASCRIQEENHEIFLSFSLKNRRKAKNNK